jgi:predicted GNAT family N-acyltransferase
MIIEEVSICSANYILALELRYHLFFKELGLPISVVPDDLEESSTHFAMSGNGELIGYARLSEISSNDYRISQVVVSPKHQGRGHSTSLLRHIMEKAASAGAQTIRLNSQMGVIGLYEKLGFQTVGEVYTVELTDLPHKKMVYHVVKNV